MSIIINKSTNDKVVVNKTTQETIKVATGIKGDVGPTGLTGPTGPTGDPGVHVGPTPPDDTSLLWVDTSSSLTGTGGQSIYGLVDPFSYPALPRVVIERTDSTTGWVAVNAAGTGGAPGAGGSPAVDASFGVGNEAITAKVVTGPPTNENLTSAFYKNLNSPVNTGNHGTISFELMHVFYYHNGNNPPFAVVAATGPNLTGTLYTLPLISTPGMVWATVFVDVPINTIIRSVGVKSVITPSAFFSDIYQFWIRDICLEQSSNVQTAQLAGKTPVVTEATTEGAVGYTNPLNHAPKLDLRRESAVLPGLGGWYDVREWNLPEDGVTDVASRIQHIVDSLPPKSSLRFPADGVFLVKSQITISKPLIIDFNNSILYDNERRGDVVGRRANDFISITANEPVYTVSTAVSDVRISNGKIYGTWYDTLNAGGALVTFSGSVTTSGSYSVLTNVGDSGEYQPRELSGNPYVRWMAQHYEPGYGVCNRYDTTLSGDGVSTVKIEVIEQDTPQDTSVTSTPIGGMVLASQTVTPPAGGASYTLRCSPNNLDHRLFLRITKMSGTAPITVRTVTPWGLSTYKGAYEGYNGITVYDGCRIMVDNWRIENTGGEGIVSRSFDFNLGDITFRDIVCRCNHTQNYAITSGRKVRLERCRSEGSARTGFDFEPYGTGWSIDELTLVDCSSVNDRNYSLSCANWGLISNLIVENFKAAHPGIGAFVGGARGGRVTGFTAIQRPDTIGYGSDNSGTNRDMGIIAKDMVFSGLSLTNGLALFSATWTTDGTYVSGGNTVIGFTKTGLTRMGADVGSALVIEDGSTVLGGSYPTDEVGKDPGSYLYGPLAARISGRPPLLGMDVGRWRKALPKTFKGLAVDQMWWPYGINGEEGMVLTEGLSGTSIKAKNLRGIGVSVPTGSASSSVVFPQKPGAANLSTTSATRGVAFPFTGPNTVSLVPNTTYYYAICALVDWDDNGHRPAVKTFPITPSTANPVALLNVADTIDWTNQTAIAGYVVYRGTGGTASGGPWDTRYFLRPSNQWFSNPNYAFNTIDTGTELISQGALSERSWGYPNITTVNGTMCVAETGTWTTTAGPMQDTTGYEYDNNYTVVVTPSWVTTVAVTAKRQSGFDVGFGTPAPSGGTFDWVLIR